MRRGREADAEIELAMKVVWISEFPIEWMSNAPDSLRKLPKQHPATWLPVLAAEFAGRAELQLHVIVLRNNVPASQSFVVDGITYHVLKIPRMTRAPSLFWTDTRAIRSKVREIRPDIVHAWGTERGAALVASRLGIPYLVTMQGIMSWYRQLIPFSMHDRFVSVLEEIALRRAPFVTTECVFAARYLTDRYPKLTVIQAEHAPSCLFHQVERIPQTKPLRLVFVGTPGHRKGTDLLLLGLERLVSELEFELIIIGGGESYIGELRPQLSSELQRRLKLIPNLMPEGVARELASATMLVLPTRVDTSPNAVKEAVVAGVPVVASAIGGVVDYVVPGLNGFTFEAGNLDAFISALRMTASHPTMSKGLVDPHCLTRMRQYLSPAQMSENFFNAYQRVLSKSS